MSALAARARRSRTSGVDVVRRVDARVFSRAIDLARASRDVSARARDDGTRVRRSPGATAATARLRAGRARRGTRDARVSRVDALRHAGRRGWRCLRREKREKRSRARHGGARAGTKTPPRRLERRNARGRRFVDGDARLEKRCR